MSHIPPRMAPNFRRGAHLATIVPPYLYNRPSSRPCDSDGRSDASCKTSSTHPCWRLVTLLTEDEVFKTLAEHFVRVSLKLSSTKVAQKYRHPCRAPYLAPWRARSSLLSSSSHLTGLLECLYYSLSTSSAGGPSHDVRYHAVRDHFTHYLLIAIRPSRTLE